MQTLPAGAGTSIDNSLARLRLQQRSDHLRSGVLHFKKTLLESGAHKNIFSLRQPQSRIEALDWNRIDIFIAQFLYQLFASAAQGVRAQEDFGRLIQGFQS